jgi:hypothetical protein
MNVKEYFESLSAELIALRDRVKNLIDGGHPPTDGEWKECVLRSMIARNLPDSIKIGRGFIITPDGPSTQIDVLLYSSDSPVLFRDGDLVFVQPHAVRGVIEVKTGLSLSTLKKAIKKIQKIGELLPEGGSASLSIFSYKHTANQNGFQEKILEFLKENTTSKNQIVNLICLGDSHFFRYWKYEPNPQTADYLWEKWHSYLVDKMAYGYFIHNVLLHLSPKYINNDSKDLWFPSEGKEPYKNGEIQRNRFAGESDRVTEWLL